MKTLTVKPLLFALGIAISVAIQADEFSDEYQSYQSASEAGDYASAVSHGLKAYELAATKYGKEDLQYAAVGLNLAAAMGQDQSQGFRGHWDEAHAIAQSSLASFEKHYGNNAIELIDALSITADVSRNNKEARNLYRRALAIAEKAKNPQLLALTQMTAFERLTGTEFYDREVLAYIRDAQQYFSANLPENATARVKANYLLANAELGNKQYSKAEPLFLDVIKQYESLNFSHPYALAARTRLIEIYEHQGEEDKATEQCQAVGKMRPWNDNQEQVPLLQIAPKFPVSVARRGKSGWVNISFTIAENGKVRDPKIIDSSGVKAIEEASLLALKDWRYAPKFVDGKPVAAESTVRLDFELAK
ncbi:energy transducer TonB [Shewanella cyperi]|uniref:energy transducer TonB n=1 Tax=Shewanella cyperi TaxID=2814292 RepID=UPI001A93B254|nr:energy transducer TonB [Shewanella cyperi]QSX40799.1 energy transducer TonB [Shewanella cyperi]